MRVLRRDWPETDRTSAFSLVPLGDVHLGSVACNEARFQAAVKRIAEDDTCYWVGLGDYCEFIARADPRFDLGALADWIGRAELVDLARAQRDRFLEMVRPIAGKCLGIVEGNHERSIRRRYERDVYLDICNTIKEWSGREGEPMGLGVTGWLLLRFFRPLNNGKRGGSTLLRVNVHHGFVGGRLAGAKALNMQRWLWTHDADLVIFGHSHNQSGQVEAVETIDQRGNIVHQRRVGVYSGSFMEMPADGGQTYVEERGYFPTPAGHPEIRLYPGKHNREDMVRVVLG